MSVFFRLPYVILFFVPQCLVFPKTYELPMIHTWSSLGCLPFFRREGEIRRAGWGQRCEDIDRSQGPHARCWDQDGFRGWHTQVVDPLSELIRMDLPQMCNFPTKKLASSFPILCFLFRSEFVFINPNSKGQCGCGESFMTSGSPRAAAGD